MSNPVDPRDLNFDDGELEHSWAGGSLELQDERPDTALGSEPGQRKWMLIGVGGCGLLTALAVLWLTHAPAADEPAAAQPEVHEPEPTVGLEAGPEAGPEPRAAAVEPAAEPVHASTKPSLATAATTAKPKQAPPPPALEPEQKSSSSAPAPAKPSSAPAPTPAPAPSSTKPQAPANPLADLPDVEGWEDADDEALRDDPVEPALDDDAPAAI